MNALLVYLLFIASLTGSATTDFRKERKNLLERRESIQVIQDQIKDLQCKLDDMLLGGESKNFFEDVDKNQDGEIKTSEIRSFVANQVGGEEYDSESEIEQGVNEVLHSLGGKENIISHVSIQERFDSISNLMSVDDVVDWIENSLLFPQYAPTFKSHSISSLDFPLILAAGPSVLEKDFQISSSLHQQQIIRSIRMKVLGIGKLPSPVYDLVALPITCRGLKIKFEVQVIEGVMPSHKYIVQFRDDDDSMWENIYNGSNQVISILNLDIKHRYDIRVQAWNNIGPSNWTVLDNMKAGKEICSEKQLSSFLENSANNNKVVVVDYLKMKSNVESTTFSIFPSISIHQLFTIVTTCGLLWIGVIYFRNKHKKISKKSTSNTKSPNISTLIRRSSSPSMINMNEGSDEAISGVCYNCKKSFGYLSNRRHNCGSCSRLFCNDHGHSKCSIVCSIAGPCRCNDCLAILETQSVNMLQRKHSSLPTRTFRGTALTVMASNRFRNLSENKAVTCSCNYIMIKNGIYDSLFDGMLMFKKMGNEKIYNKRFVWISHKPGTTKCDFFLHWTKSNKKDDVNKVLSFYDVKNVVNTEPSKGGLNLKSISPNSSLKCISIIHKVLSKPSLDLQAFEISEKEIWFDGIKFIIENCKLDSQIGRVVEELVDEE